jgi:hypothetical protein
MLSFENSFEQIARFYFRNVSIQVFVGVVSIVTVFACLLPSFDTISFFSPTYFRYPQHLSPKLRCPQVSSHGGLVLFLLSSPWLDLDDS